MKMNIIDAWLPPSEWLSKFPDESDIRILLSRLQLLDEEIEALVQEVGTLEVWRRQIKEHLDKIPRT